MVWLGFFWLLIVQSEKREIFLNGINQQERT
jgi:hypothetical protein